MRLDGGFADEQLGRDLAVGSAAGDEHQDLPLARRKSRVGGRGRAAHRAEQPRGDGRGDDGAALGRGAHGREQLLARRVLEQVPGRARLDRGNRVGVRVVGGEDQHPGARAAAGELGDRVDAVAPRHAQVHQDDVGIEAEHEVRGLGAAGALPEHGEAGSRGEHGAQSVPYDGMVVHEQQRDVSHDTTHSTRGRIAISPSTGEVTG